jgi:hypothetical protein
MAESHMGMTFSFRQAKVWEDFLGSCPMRTSRFNARKVRMQLSNDMLQANLAPLLVGAKSGTTTFVKQR